MEILVTGATGVIGRRVVPKLVADGHAVTAVARGPDKADALREQGARPVEVDLFDPGAVAAVVVGRDAVINLATRIPPSGRAAFRAAWVDNDRLRRDASAILVDAAVRLGVSRFVQESITFLYADGGDAWLDEHAPVDAAGVTATALTAEQHIARVNATGGVGVVLRFAQFAADDSTQLREQLPVLHRGILPMFGDHDGYESYIDVDDAAEAVVAALAAPAGIYNVADDEPLTRRTHAAILSDVLGRTVHLPPAAAGKARALRVRARSQRVSNRRLRDTTGWRPQTTSMRLRWPGLIAALERDRVART